MTVLVRASRFVAAVALAAALGATALAGPDADPLEPLRPALERQDQYAEKGRFDEMVAEARQKARDGTPEALYLLGRALGNTAVARKAEGKTEDADRLLSESQRCFEAAKESGLVVYVPAYLGLARCARSRGDLEAAESQLREALKVSPAFKAAAIDLAQVLAERKRPADAEFVLYQQIERRPNDPELRLLLGMLKLTRERWGEAEKEFRTVVEAYPSNPIARKLLGGALLNQRSYAEAADHLDRYRQMVPKDEEVWRLLFLARMKTKDREAALRVLDEAQRALPGSETATWAAKTAEEYRAAPERMEEADEKTPRALVKKLESADPVVLAQALADMRAYEWDALPAGVYKLLAPAAAPAPVRKAAVALIGEQKDPRTVTILEILLFHPKEQDPDVTVRREAASALAGLPSPGVVPILVKALDNADDGTREAAVRGIASVTGKYFRDDLAVPTSAEAWPAERKLYDAWWRTSAGGSLAKRDACRELAKLFAPIERGRRRLAEYALPAVDDPDPKTWRAGYDLFRALTGQDFGAAAGEADPAARARIAQSCRDWFLANGNQE